MPIYDYECQGCGHITERIERSGDDGVKKCVVCGETKSVRIISATGQYCGNQDATWLKSVTDVINRDTSNPMAKEFMSNPTRANYRMWMKSEDLRPMERNEQIKPQRPDFSRINREVWENHQARNRIEI